VYSEELKTSLSYHLSYVYVVIYQLYLYCIVLIVLVLISFSHGYSAILAAKLMIKLDDLYVRRLLVSCTVRELKDAL